MESGRGLLRQAAMRLEGKTAIVIGAGQSPGEGTGNGRATVLRFAQEGAKVMAVDRDLPSKTVSWSNGRAAVRRVRNRRRKKQRSPP
jgi:NAD(P)-dependent dehydrogenase (short-subunit alcohol dehydrogenase family)